LKTARLHSLTLPLKAALLHSRRSLASATETLPHTPEPLSHPGLSLSLTLKPSRLHSLTLSLAPETLPHTGTSLTGTLKPSLSHPWTWSASGLARSSHSLLLSFRFVFLFVLVAHMILSFVG
jgi:hypothetical protein